MKKIFLFATLALLSTIFSSCKKEIFGEDKKGVKNLLESEIEYHSIGNDKDTVERLYFYDNQNQVSKVELKTNGKFIGYFEFIRNSFNSNVDWKSYDKENGKEQTFATLEVQNGLLKKFIQIAENYEVYFFYDTDSKLIKMEDSDGIECNMGTYPSQKVSIKYSNIIPSCNIRLQETFYGCLPINSIDNRLPSEIHCIDQNFKQDIFYNYETNGNVVAKRKAETHYYDNGQLSGIYIVETKYTYK
jgi:hypothetical protein